IERLLEGPPEEPVFWPAVAGASVIGRVRTQRDEPADADVELWEPLQPGQTPRLDDDTPALRRRAVVAQPAGRVQFDRIAAPPILLVASHRSLGTARRWVTELGPLAELELTPPARAIGRVLKRGIPVALATIRFVPDLDAFSSSADPSDYV